MSRQTTPAVFLSYAREDTEAAQRIAEALRAAGVQLWFDQSELRGGEAWDQSIRRQIKECALFVPVISAHTEERHEGYFRLEWSLAEERTHLMARGVPFILPVVIDGTNEARAVVPERFREVQWFKLPGGEPKPEFLERVQRLIAQPRKSLFSGHAVAAPEPPGPIAVTPPEPRRYDSLPVRPAKGRRKTIWIGAVALIALAVAGFIAFRPAESKSTAAPLPAGGVKLPDTATDKSIAVLPFANLSDDKENTAFFSDGMHEDILTSLANIRDLRVVSRTSVMEYRNTTKKIPQIARELGVAYILEGSVRRAGNQVRITGQLIRAANDEHLWAKSYDRELTPKDVFAIQAALSTEIAGALQAAISPETKKLLERRPTENLAAYDLYLKGRARQGTRPNRGIYREREQLFRSALDFDPKFAEAWGELAAVHADFVLQDFDHTPERLAQADAAIGRAVLLAPESPEVIRLVGNYAYYAHRDYVRAAEQYEKVIRLQPNNSEAIYRLGTVQRRQGRWPESVALMRKATELDPGNAAQFSQLVISFLALRRWDDALAMQRRVMALLPASVTERLRLAQVVFSATGSTREADDCLAGLTPAERGLPRVLAAQKFWADVKGNYAEWRRLDEQYPFFDDTEESPWQQAVNAALIAVAHGDQAYARARLGDFPAELRVQLEREPANVSMRQWLSIIEAVLGQKADALRDAQKALELVPPTLDVLIGARNVKNLAAVCALVGDKDRAISELGRLLQTPAAGMTVHTLRADAAFAPLRSDPRFEALLNDPKNNRPLF